MQRADWMQNDNNLQMMKISNAFLTSSTESEFLTKLIIKNEKENFWDNEICR